MSFLSVILTLIFVSIMTLSIEQIMGVFFEKRRTSLLIFLSTYLLFFALFSLTLIFVLHYLYTHSRPMLIVGSLLGLLGNFTYFLIALNYEGDLPKRLIAALCSYTFFSISMAISILTLVISVGGDLAFDSFQATLGVGEGIAVIFPMIIGGFITYIIAALLRRYQHIRKNEVSSPIFWVATVIIPSLSAGVIMVLVVLSDLTEDFPQGVIIIFIMLFAINLLMFYIQDTLSAAYEDKLKATLYDQEKEYYFSQCQLMQKSVDDVRSVHHDMKSHLTTTRDYIAKNQTGDAIIHLDSLLGNINEFENYSDTGNIVFDSIINFKLKHVLEENIKLEMNVFIPPTLDIEIIDVVTILGNLLDNALDAVAKVDDKRITLNVESAKGNLFIKIENTFDGIVEYAEGKGDVGKAIVSRKDGDAHGYGLKNVRKSVEKYNGHMDITHDNGVFTVGILLYV